MDNIFYEWDASNFEEGDRNTKPIEYQKLIIQKYNALLKRLTVKYGKSTSTGDLTNLSKLGQKHGLQKQDIWSLDSLIQIQNTQHRKNGNINPENVQHRAKQIIKR